MQCLNSILEVGLFNICYATKTLPSFSNDCPPIDFLGFDSTSSTSSVLMTACWDLKKLLNLFHQEVFEEGLVSLSFALFVAGMARLQII